MSTKPENPGWLITVVGLLLYVTAWLLTDLAVHSRKWANGQAAHRFSQMLPSAIVSGIAFAFINSVVKRWQQRKPSV